MTPQELELGNTVLLTLAPASGTALPEEFEAGAEVRLWRDGDSGTPFISRAQAAATVREHPEHGTQLDDLCTMNLHRVSWIMDRKRSPEGDRLLLQVHQFPDEIALPDFDIVVNEQSFDQARRVNPKLRLPEDLIAWLTDECLLPDCGSGLGTRAFLSMGRQNAAEAGEAFVLHGSSLRAFVRRTSVPGADGTDVEGMLVERVTRSRRNLGQRTPVYLVSGNVRFLDRTDRVLRARELAQLAAIRMSDESFLRAWERYGEIEERLLLKKLLNVGALEYDNTDLLPDGDLQFNLLEPLPELACEFLDEQDDLEVGTSRPDLEAVRARLRHLETEEKKRSDLEKPPARPGIKSELVGELAETPIAGSRSLVLRGDVLTAPGKGWLYVSVQGSAKVFERREKARDAISSGSSSGSNGRCPIPRLALLLEGAHVSSGKAGNRPPLSNRVLNKVFRTREGHTNPPTDAQKEAINVALNTPDIALIQGPPGTGKTTVIRAIIERLNELADASSGLSGNFLVTGFQHDAVENAIAKLDVNDLPAIKFGQRDGVDGYAEAEARIDRWRQERAEGVRHQFGTVPRTDTERRLKEFLHAYVLAPGDLRQTVHLLDEVARLVRGQLSPQLMDELSRLTDDIRRLRRAAELGETGRLRITRAIRAIRCTPAAFLDDGPRTAGVALSTLRDELQEPDRGLLEKASRWVGSETPPFVAGLAELRQRLLAAQLPAAKADSVPRVRQDVASLLARLRDDLEAMSRRTRSGPDVITAEFLDQLENSPDVVRRAIIDYTTVFAATCQQAASYRVADAKKGGNLEYESVLVDEAARCNPLDLFIPMAQAWRRIILVGDHRQLPHIIDTAIQRELDLDVAGDSESASEKMARALEESLFERLFRQLQAREKRDGIKRTVTLDTQYRMHPRLGRFVAEQFYPANEQFGSGFGPERFGHALPGYEGQFAAWVHVPVERGRERPGQSKSRSVEAEVIARELKRLIDSDAARELTFGVITFYSSQVLELGKHLTGVGGGGLMSPLGRDGYRVADAYRDLRLPDGKVVERLRVGTVDAFQGKEFDVVFLSMVRSNREEDVTEKERRRKYGHLMSPNRLCVGMSRQKCLLIVVGDAGMLRAPHAGQAILPLVKYFDLCKEEGVIHGVHQDRTVNLGQGGADEL